MLFFYKLVTSWCSVIRPVTNGQNTGYLSEKQDQINIKRRMV